MSQQPNNNEETQLSYSILPPHSPPPIVSFSAHVDFVQNRDFITRVGAKNIILVHGQKNEMGRLKSALQVAYGKMPENQRPTISMPPNAHPVKLHFERRRFAKVMGSLAKTHDNPKEGDELGGILFTQNFQSRIVAPADLATYTQLRVGAVKSKLHVPFVGSLQTLRLFLSEMFAGVIEVESKERPGEGGLDEEVDVTSFLLHSGAVSLVHGRDPSLVTIEWEASPVSDMLADAAVALVMHAQGSAAGIRISSKPCNHGGKSVGEKRGVEEGQEEGGKKKNRIWEGEDISEMTPNEVRLRMANKLLKSQFSKVDVDYDLGTYVITCECAADKSEVRCDVSIDFDEENDGCVIRVQCDDEGQGGAVRECLRQLATAAAPLHV